MGEGGETRKIQFTGRSSYIVSLPKGWVTDMGLRRGDEVRIVRQGRSALQVYPPRRRGAGPRRDAATLVVGAGEEAPSVARKLISVYFLGSSTIHVRPAGARLGAAQREAVKDARRMLMGMEVTSDSASGMTVQVPAGAPGLSVDGAFKRMVHVAESMLADAVRALRDGDAELARDVVRADDEVDRFGFYIIRQLKVAIQSEHVLREMGLGSARSCLGYRVAAKSIERAADHAVNMARDLLEFGSGLGPEHMDGIEGMRRSAVAALDSACLALFKGDHEQAERTIREAALAARAGDGRAAGARGGREEYRARRIADNVRRIAEYASDIAEIALNINIEKALRKG